MRKNHAENKLKLLKELHEKINDVIATIDKISEDDYDGYNQQRTLYKINNGKYYIRDANRLVLEDINNILLKKYNLPRTFKLPHYRNDIFISANEVIITERYFSNLKEPWAVDTVSELRLPIESIYDLRGILAKKYGCKEGEIEWNI